MPKFLLRLLGFSFILAAISVISIGLISYYIASGDIEEKVKEGNMQVLLQTQMRIEQVLKTLEFTSLQYLNSPLVVESMNKDLSTDDFIEIRDLSKGLFSLQTYTGIREAYLVNLQNDWLVSFSIFRKFSTFADNARMASYAQYPNSLFWVTGNLMNNDTRASTTEVFSEDASIGSKVIRMIYKIPIPTKGQPKGLLIVEIGNSELRELLSSNNKLGEVFLLDRNGNDFLAEGSMIGRNREIHTMVAQHIAETNEESGFFNAEVNDKMLGITFRSSPFNGWMYVSAVSIKDITQQSRKIAWITFIACSIIFVLVGLFALYGSRKMYSPIKRLFEFTKAIEIEGQDNKDEFLSIEKRFTTLFSTEKMLQQQVIGQFSQLKEFFMLKLFAGQLSDSEFAYRSQIFGFPTEWKRLGVLAVQIDSLQETRYQEHDKELLLFAINNIVGEIISKEDRFSPILLNQSQVTLLLSSYDNDAQLKQQFYEIAEQIKAKVHEFLQLPVSIGISRPFERVTQSVLAYGECLEALKCRMSLGQEIIIHYEDIDAGKKMMEVTVYTQLKLMEDQLGNALKSGDRAAVDGIFDKYIAAIVEKGIHFNEYPVLMMQLIAKVFHLVQEQGGSVKHVLGKKATIEHFLKLTTLESIIQWFKAELFEPIISFSNQQAESQYMNIANQMIKLVHERYDQEISLEACASILSFHPVYLSRVFKKEMNVNFSEYLAEYRMTIAKNWLENTSWKISEIAEKLNYTNTTAFIRTFRKIVDMTPGQYRDQYNKDL
ncbi:Helix-turn-helix domain-containing protein [Paenibacillus sp. 1_12]|uniref:helix-turn-helix domain-containing protein n=1 Tax=Paenibacillus sp. 1_12 TaxID=1566278 RepID=UPI0008E8FF9E|nr:helix-turn-helix domain-containing protein [Paenibacillus sp. 1_12]SFK80308.1 Helix-turn-helix domain-containing protein [Paenibacillus sp. 1_12]